MKKLTRESTGASRNHPVKVLQFGEGNFLRGFADWIIDVMNERTGFHGAVEIVQPIAKGLSEMLNAQDGLYHVVLNGIQNGKTVTETRLITSVTGAFNPYEDFKRFLRSAENPDLEFILSNTTEAGITFLESDTDPTTLPDSFPGKLTVLLYHRFNHFTGAADKGLTLMPCELIEKNGDTLRQVILRYIDHWKLSAAFRQWVIDNNTFCNTLVDRIVPGFPKDTLTEIHQSIGYEDNLVVMAEPFHLWVLEAPEAVKKSFPADQAGLQVQFVKDLTPYRTRKVRILNGAHTALVPVAYLRGLRTVRESMDDEYAFKFICKAIEEEIIPTLDLSKGELLQFSADVIERFQNPFIRHELSSIALNSISKYKVRVLPSVLRYVEIKNQLPAHLLFSLASLIRFYKGVWRGEKLPVNDSDEIIAFFNEAWKRKNNHDVATTVLSNKNLWDSDLTKLAGVTELVAGYLDQLDGEEREGEK